MSNRHLLKKQNNWQEAAFGRTKRRSAERKGSTALSLFGCKQMGPILSHVFFILFHINHTNKSKASSPRIQIRKWLRCCTLLSRKLVRVVAVALEARYRSADQNVNRIRQNTETLRARIVLIFCILFNHFVLDVFIFPPMSCVCKMFRCLQG